MRRKGARGDFDFAVLQRSRESADSDDNAVHAAMSGRTEMVVGRWHGRFVHVPMPLTIRERNQVDPNGDLWMSVLESTGQPLEFTPDRVPLTIAATAA